MDRFLNRYAPWLALGIIITVSIVSPDGPAAGAEHHEGGFVDQLLELLASPAHWVFEIVSDVVVTVALAVLFKPLWSRLIRERVARHDAEHHGIHPHAPDPRDGLTVIDHVGVPHPFDAEFCGDNCQPIDGRSPHHAP